LWLLEFDPLLFSTLCTSRMFHFSPYVLASISTKDGTIAPYILSTTLIRIIQIGHNVLSKLSFECFGLLYHLKIHQGEGAPPISCHYKWGIFSHSSSCPKFSCEASLHIATCQMFNFHLQPNSCLSPMSKKLKTKDIIDQMQPN
jgi:hypothetical protein